MFVLVVSKNTIVDDKITDAGIFLFKGFDKLIDAQKYSDDAINAYHSDDAIFINSVERSKWVEASESFFTKFYKIVFDDKIVTYDSQIKEF